MQCGQGASYAGTEKAGESPAMAIGLLGPVPANFLMQVLIETLQFQAQGKMIGSCPLPGPYLLFSTPFVPSPHLVTSHPHLSPAPTLLKAALTYSNTHNLLQFPVLLLSLVRL